MLLIRYVLYHAAAERPPWVS